MPWAANGVVSTVEIPEGFEISEQQYGEALAGIVVGKMVSVDSGGFAMIDHADPKPEEEEEPETLENMKTRLKTEINYDAEVERKKFITSGSGQAMTYMQKAEEAKRYLADPSPENSMYPLLSAEVGITASTIHDVASVVTAAHNRWQYAGAKIEGQRLRAKSAIESSTTIEGARQAYDSVIWLIDDLPPD